MSHRPQVIHSLIHKVTIGGFALVVMHRDVDTRACWLCSCVHERALLAALCDVGLAVAPPAGGQHPVPLHLIPVTVAESTRGGSEAAIRARNLREEFEH